MSQNAKIPQESEIIWWDPWKVVAPACRWSSNLYMVKHEYMCECTHLESRDGFDQLQYVGTLHISIYIIY